jgi:hypothetical protein
MVVWQHDDSVYSERMSNPRISNAAERLYMVGEQAKVAFRQIHREE